MWKATIARARKTVSLEFIKSRISGAFGNDQRNRDNLSTSPHSSSVWHTLETWSCENGSGEEGLVAVPVGVSDALVSLVEEDGDVWYGGDGYEYGDTKGIGDDRCAFG